LLLPLFIDTANYRSQNNIKAQPQIIDMNNSLDLIDIWRAINPDTKRYTWRGPDLKQSRLDYCLISSDFEPFVTKVDTEISYRSDHSPVCLALQFYNQTKGRGTWKFNNSLLHDKEYATEVIKCIVETVDQYTLPGFEGEDIELSINPQMFWELLKCMIRGKTISYSSYLKKKNQSLKIEYEKNVHTLQLNYEYNPSEALGNKIKQTEDDLKMLRENKFNGIMARQKLDGQQKEKMYKLFL
jgi:hypothetical protein